MQSIYHLVHRKQKRLLMRENAEIIKVIIIQLL